jgi:hypothetical protein
LTTPYPFNYDGLQRGGGRPGEGWGEEKEDFYRKIPTKIPELEKEKRP